MRHGPLLPVLKQFWGIWLMALFVGIVVWVFWPSRRKQMEDDPRIPFRMRRGRMAEKVSRDAVTGLTPPVTSGTAP